MPDPTRPVAGAPIDTDWGQQVHDRVFQPKGVRCHGDSQAVGVTPSQLNLNHVDDDPGGWLASDTLTVPSGAGGLYSYGLRVSTDDGDPGEQTVVNMRVNGSAVIQIRIDAEGSTAQFGGVGDIIELSAGDTIELWANKTGGPNHNVIVRSFQFVIIGTSIGA